MTAEPAHQTDRCGSCGSSCGEVRYRLRSKLIRCKACAEKIGPLPELPLPDVQQRVHPSLPKFSPFEARRAWKVVQSDWKQKQAGE